MIKSENKNFIYNVIYQLLSFIIPFVTVPYVSRVLGVENIGTYSYTYSIVYMFMLVGMLGINNYGNRSIAAVRDNKDELSITFSSIYYMQLIINVISLFGYIFYLLFICKGYKSIAFIQGIFLISICFDVNWFFFGIEQFKLTITRNFIIKLSSVILVFLLVKSTTDLWLYVLIMAGSTLLSQVFLFLLLHKYVKICKVSVDNIFSHLKGISLLFIPVLAFGIYKVIDKTMIGMFSSVTEVGFYENAEKVINIPAAIISALGTVMLPRMSYILSKGNSDYKEPIFASMKLATKMSVIMSFGLILVASDAVILLFGTEFERSGPILTLLSVTIIASSWANVIRTQYLIPLKKDGIYINSTIGAAFINLLLNLFFIKRYAAMGACIGTIAAEYFVMFYQMFGTRHELEYHKYAKYLFTELAKSGMIIIIVYFITVGVGNCVLRFTIRILISGILFFSINRKYIFKEFLGRE